MKKIILFIAWSLLIYGCKTEEAKLVLDSNNPSKVEVRNTNGKFELLVNGSPFYIKGAGLEFGDVEALAKHNANSFRTWRTDNGKKSGKEVLDEALENGLMVTMGIDIARERHGFDYDDPVAVKEQFDRVQKEVEELKEHPALLIWAIGNELNHSYTNPNIWHAVNDIAKMIHEIDPNHPTTTTLAGIEKEVIDHIKEKCPEIDILSFQMYGDLPDLHEKVKEFSWDGPYMVTEWGASGWWEAQTTSWGAPIEDNSTLKASNYLKRYKKGIEIDSLQCIGSYVFLWGHKQERTPTWFGVFLENGMETESIDIMHHIWNNKWPENRTPQLKFFSLENKTANDNIILKKGESYSAKAIVFDFENDAINYSWEIMEESKAKSGGGDFENRPKSFEIDIVYQNDGLLTFKSPGSGEYRLFVYANDGNDHAAFANIPFKVE